MFCDGTDSYIKFFDGWIHNNETWPSDENHYKKSHDKRMEMMCGRKEHYFQSDQNIIQIFYKIKDSGRGFRIKFQFQKNKNRCNMIVRTRDQTLTEQTFVMRPYKRKAICTFLVIDWPWNRQTFTGMIFRINKMRINDQRDECIAERNAVKQND
ncbi:hypothetical protein BLA29_010289 [Euroglyphus maynei]|uniref:Corticotropin-releasing factor binding protein N-terminal domain-containing protein n=1 Tax=Euroglyphus maynei TaxID=6958 RepID=A0A1Y3B803_EURMA|nr:hypothetical protein BLA29_010289 [Euroglyphus maynei]